MQYQLAMYNYTPFGLGDFAAYSAGQASGTLNIIDSAMAASPAQEIRTRNALGYADIDRAHLIKPAQIVQFSRVPVEDQIALLQGAQASDAFPRGVLTTSSAGDKTAVNKLVNRFKIPYGYSDSSYGNLANQLVNFSVDASGVNLTPVGSAAPPPPPVVVVPAPDTDSDTVWRLLGYPTKDAWRAAGKPPLTSTPPSSPPVASPPTVSAWTYCGQQNEQCVFPGTARVRYGANGSYAEGIFTGGVACGTNNTPGVFGHDPAPGVVKRCEWTPTSSVAPPAPPFIPLPTPPVVVAPAPPVAPPVLLTPDPDSDTVWRILGYPTKDAWRAAGKPQVPTGGGTIGGPPPSLPGLPAASSSGSGASVPPVVAASPTPATSGAPAGGDDGTLFGFPKQTVLLAGVGFFALLLLKK